MISGCLTSRYERKLVYYTQAGGWKIALSRFQPRGKGPVRPAVLLVHGMASNAQSFDFRPECSLARQLSENGHDVWALDLRGHGLSEKPSWTRPGRYYSWCFDDYLKHEIPAALETIRQHTGAARVHWIGHSMGGLLLYAFLSKGGKDALLSGVAIGSSLDYSVSRSDFRKLERLWWLAHAGRVAPVGLLGKLLAPIAGKFDNPVARFNYWRSNLAPGAAADLHRRLLHDVSTRVLLQLRSAVMPGGVRPQDSTTPYLEGLRTVEIPILAISGEKDRQCPPEAVQNTFDSLGATDKRHQTFGKSFGHEDHYGHMDLLIGRNVSTEVYPVILEWLQSHEEFRATDAGRPTSDKRGAVLASDVGRGTLPD